MTQRLPPKGDGPPAGEITDLLRAAEAGDPKAADSLFAAVYAEMRRIARRQLSASGRHGNLDTTELVHEAYLKLSHGAPWTIRDRYHFYAATARAMRQVIVDDARRRFRGKRGSGMRAIALDDVAGGLPRSREARRAAGARRGPHPSRNRRSRARPNRRVAFLQRSLGRRHRPHARGLREDRQAALEDRSRVSLPPTLRFGAGDPGVTDSANGRMREAAPLFEELAELPPEQAEVRLAEIRKTDVPLEQLLRGLLAAEREAGNFLEGGAVAYASPTLARELAGQDDGATGPAGEWIGPYVLVSLLGRGGMGEVWVARRQDGQFEQQVALKLLTRGSDSEGVRRRFLQERQVLARLEHPHIARLLDGGTASDGRPYFVMELVRGETITEYCRKQQPRAGGSPAADRDLRRSRRRGAPASGGASGHQAIERSRRRAGAGEAARFWHRQGALG